MITIETMNSEAITTLAHCILWGLLAVSFGIIALGACIAYAASEMSQWESSEEEDEDDDDQSEAWKKADR